MAVVLVHPDQIGLETLRPQYASIMASKHGRKRSLPIGMFLLLMNTPNAYFIDNAIHQLTNSQLAEWCIKKAGKKGIVGFGGTCMEWKQASVVSRLIRKHRPDIITVYGGPNATAQPEKHRAYFDYIFLGNAYHTFPHFVEKGEKALEGVYLTPDTKPIYELDGEIKWPTLRNIETLFPSSVNHYAPNVVFSSAGCPFNCKFCAAKYIWKQHVFFRKKEEVIEEIKYLKSKGIKRIVFREDNFTIRKERLLYFCKELKNLSMEWYCQARISSLDETLIEIMKACGCIQISCGFESINDSSLKAINKGHTAQDIENVIHWCQKHKLRYTGGFIVGFPNEGKTEIKNTIEFTRKVATNSYSDIPKDPVQFLGIPVSDLYYEVIRKDLVEYDWNDGELLFCGTNRLSCKEVEKLINE